VSFVQVALPLLPVSGWADLVFSTATFHWVKDHPSLFAGIYAALRSGGRLHAQCGGGPNLARAHALADRVMHLEPFARHFDDWPGPWEFAGAEVTTTRLGAAGFVDVTASLEEAPTTLASEADYREFVTTVIYHPHLDRLPDGSLKAAFIDHVTELSSQEDPPFTLDYWRLNMNGRKP
jgi:trans-aconitate 2-methyltransferase